jgi:hypothetical protein
MRETATNSTALVSIHQRAGAGYARAFDRCVLHVAKLLLPWLLLRSPPYLLHRVPPILSTNTHVPHRSRSDVISWVWESHPPAGNVTFETWAMPSDPFQTYFPLMSYAVPGKDNFWAFYLVPGSEDGLQLQVVTFQDNVLIFDDVVSQDDPALETPTWVHIALTFNGATGEVKSYVNGEYVGGRVATTGVGEGFPTAGVNVIGQVGFKIDFASVNSTAPIVHFAF